jgi:hypothetical protein
MKKLIGATALALVMFGMSGGAEASAAEPPPPPIDWDATPVPFEPFWVYGGPRTDGHVFSMATASYPEEGRRLCEFYRQWDYPNDPLWGCQVIPQADEYTFGPDGLVTSPDGPPAIEIVFG